MLFIVLSHMCVHGGVSTVDTSFTFNEIFVQCGVLGNLGVDIFVLITGYFISEKSFSVKRLSSLFAQVWFYSLLLTAVAVWAFQVDVGVNDVIRAVFPTIFTEYWFFTAYVILLLVSPFLNIAIRHMERASFLKLLLCLMILWVIIPSVTTQGMYSGHIPHFVSLYFVGAYFKKYPDLCFSQKKLRYLCVLACWSLLILLTVGFHFLGDRLPGILSGYRENLYAKESILIVGIAVGLFAFAVYSKPFTSRIINIVSSCVFGTYLIHDHPLIRNVLWTRILHVTELYHSRFFIFYAIAAVFTVFACCVLIEFVRLKTISKPLDRAVEWLIGKIGRLLPEDR
jgi:surface polysaccharide O-acyltransferase-like enzyme